MGREGREGAGHDVVVAAERLGCLFGDRVHGGSGGFVELDDEAEAVVEVGDRLPGVEGV